ncbi:MAG: antitoxin [Actinoallomurus sp.]
MSIVDKVKELLGQHGDKVDKAVDKAGDMLDEKTGGKYADKVDKAQEQAKKATDRWGEEDRRPNSGPS